VSLIWNGDNEVGRTADENARRDALERMGFETRWDSPNNGQSWWTTYAATGNGLFNAIYVLGTTDTDTLGDKLRSVGCPILSENPALDDNVGFSDAEGNSSLGLWIDVQTAAHPITATSGAGALHIYDSSQKIAMLQGTPAPSLVSLATRTSQTCLAAVESGGTLANTVGGNATAAARRVRLPFGGENTPVDWSAVNAAGLELLEQSVLWATAATYTPGSSEGVLVMLTDDNGVLSEGETFRVRRLAYWGFTVVLLWDGAGQADYDAAIATADAVYVPGLADASDVGDKLRECPIGVVYEKGGLDDNLGLSNQEGSADSSNSSQVADRTHPIVANFRDGENLGFFNRFSYENNNWPGSSESLSRLAGTLAPDLWVAMTRGGVPVLATLDTGQDLANNVGGNTAASGRRVRLPWVDDADLTLMRSWSAGSQVLYNALRWAAGPYGGELVVHYKFEPVVGTTVTDHSGKGYYGDARGGVTMNVSPAPRSLAANFDANGEHVYHAPTSHFRDLAKNNGDCTIAFWVRPHEPTQTNWRNLLHVGGADANDRGPLVMLNASNQRPSCWFSTTAISTGAGSTCATLLNNDQWQHVAIVKSGYYVRWYVDGKYVNASRLQGESVATAGELRVGHDGWWGQPDADMDDVRLYNYALADSQITELYAGLVGHFVLDDGAGAEAVDSSVFENTATLQGDPTWDTDDPSLVLDGAGDHALAPSGGQYDLDSDLTIAAWVRVADPDQSRYMRIFSRKSAWSANDGYELEYNPALNRLTLGGRDRQQLAAWGVDLGDEWAHVAATLTSVAGGKYRARLYLNGVELTNVTAWSANPSTMAVDNFDQLVPGTQNLAIGANPSGGDAFNGALRDVRL
ncbi:MAG: LamG domain-containing protein, partial [Planctomycetota bacterium]